jgi:hypothetical protein
MHSVLIFGDVRTHYFQSKPGPDKSVAESGMIYGGAFLMAKAISQAIDDLAGQFDAVPGLFGFSSKALKGWLGSGYRKWELVESVTGLVGVGAAGEDAGKKVFRLKLMSHKQAPEESVELPSIPKEITRALGRVRAINIGKMETTDALPTGFFERSVPGTTDKMPWCPDLIVFDDLADVFRNVKLEETLQQLDETTRLVKETSIDRAVPRGTLPGTLKGKRLYEATLRLIAKRLLHAARAISLRRDVTLEPVIICSVTGRLPDLECAPTARPTVWQCLAHNSALRTRTVILLDVEELRQHEGLGISSGLSWERTAQETVSAFRRSKRFRQFLGFGVVIVRFGATAALQISRTSSGVSYRLFFDPNRADHDFTDADPDDHVLGYSSVFTASLVHEMTRVCNERGEKPLLHDLPEAVSQGIPQAIARCQSLFAQGYGEAPGAEEAIAAIERRLGFTELFDNPNLASSISQVEVPEQSMRNWSILGQSAQGNMGRVARDVVM